MEQYKYEYCDYGGSCEHIRNSHGLNDTFEQSIKGYQNTCCATYVSWVLQKCGYISDSEHFNDCGTEEDLLLSKGWKKISGSLSNLQPGDIIIYFSGGSRVHTDIYVGDGKKLNAGSDYSIRDIHFDTFNEYRAYNIYRPK